MATERVKTLRDYVQPSAHLTPADLVRLKLRDVRALKSAPANSNNAKEQRT